MNDKDKRQEYTAPEPKQEEVKAPKGNCPDCNGDGIKSPTDIRVCATCEGRGSIN